MRILYLTLLIFITSLSSFAQNGVLIHDKAKTDNCYRLISSRNLTVAHLIAPNGRYVHSWHFQSAEGATNDFSGFGMTWHYAEMLPNGHLLAIIKDEMIIELDWNSNLVWQAKLRAHHDFARTDKNSTIVVSRRDESNPWQEEKSIALDELVEYDKTGNIIWTWKYKDHLDEFGPFVQQPIPPDKSFRDWPHINTCEVLPTNPLEKKDNRFKAGNLLLCGRHSNTIFIIDRNSGKVVWAWGPSELEGPHMPTMLENGNILVYDNGNHLKSNSRGFTRVLEINPLSGKIIWSYQSKNKTDFFSPSRGSNNRLENGNTLIAESDSGHLLEVTSKGEIVWEYWNSDLTNRGSRMALYRVVPYSTKLVDSLLTKYGLVQDYAKEYQESLKWEKLGPDHQYKRYLREVVFYTEIGYYDHALNFLDEFMKVFVDDPEGYFGYAVVHSAKNNPQLAFEYMQKAIQFGMPLDRFTVIMGDMLTSLQNSQEFNAYLKSQKPDWVHGPVLGDLTPTSAKFWLRTFGELPVQVVAREKGDLDFNKWSDIVTTSQEKENTAVVELNNLQPSTDYEYKLVVNSIVQDKLFEFSTAPKYGESVHFSTGFGGGAGYTPQYEHMWDTILSHDLPFFLLLGDNVYIDHPLRPTTQSFCYFRRQSRPEYRRVSANTAIYAIWDDHDFTFNDGKGSPQVNEPYWKMDVWNLFKTHWNNPYYGGGEQNPGCWFDFSYGDVDFIMLDCRYYREQPKGRPEASMLGPFQKQWLFEKLKNSKGTFKVIASSVPWAKGTKPGSLDTWDGHPQEREELFKFIEDNKIEGVVLISADRHRSDAWKIERPNGYDFYEFESSKISNIHTHKIMPNSLFGYNKKCSFGILEFDTTLEDPKVIYKVININNDEIHRLTLFKSDLVYNK